MPKPSNITVKDPTANRDFDSGAKVLDSAGKVVREPGKIRKNLISDLVALLQSTINDKVSGVDFGNRVDMVGNKLSELKLYSTSLKEAAAAIETNYPSGPDDVPLDEIKDLCDILEEGVTTVEQYMAQARAFAEDLDRIKGEFNNQITVLFNEVN